MQVPHGHRKSVKHFDLPGHAHELTFSCHERLPLLDSDRYKVLLSVVIDRAIERHGFRLAGFVYMPEHVHLLVWPADSAQRACLSASPDVYLGGLQATARLPYLGGQGTRASEGGLT